MPNANVTHVYVVGRRGYGAVPSSACPANTTRLIVLSLESRAASLRKEATVQSKDDIYGGTDRGSGWEKVFLKSNSAVGNKLQGVHY